MKVMASMEVIEVHSDKGIFLGRARFCGVNSDTGEAIVEVYYGSRDDIEFDEAADRIREWILEVQDSNRVCTDV